MDLKTFVETTLIQIIEGSAAAISYVQNTDLNAKINPFSPQGFYSNPKDVEFDVAVTVTDAKSGGGGAGIKVAAFHVGGQGEVRVESQAVSRIRFSIPVAVSGTPIEQYRNATMEESGWNPLT